MESGIAVFGGTSRSAISSIERFVRAYFWIGLDWIGGIRLNGIWRLLIDPLARKDAFVSQTYLVHVLTGEGIKMFVVRPRLGFIVSWDSVMYVLEEGREDSSVGFCKARLKIGKIVELMWDDIFLDPCGMILW